MVFISFKTMYVTFSQKGAGTMNSVSTVLSETDVISSEEYFQRSLVLEPEKDRAVGQAVSPYISGRRHIAHGKKQAKGNPFGQPDRRPWLVNT